MRRGDDGEGTQGSGGKGRGDGRGEDEGSGAIQEELAQNRGASDEALRGYKEIHLRAFKLLRPGGTLATFCCSHHVDASTFQDVILSAALRYAPDFAPRGGLFGKAPTIPSSR